MKWIFVVLFGLGSAGSLAMAVLSATQAQASTSRTAPQLALREFPQLIAMAGTVKPPEVEPKPAEPEAVKPPEPEVAKPAEPEVAKPEPVAAKPEPVAAKPEPVVVKPEPVVAKPAPKPEPVAAKPEPVAAKPEPVAVAPKPEPVAVAPKPEPVAAAPKAAPVEGVLNLRASDTADVFLDGKKLGGSPLLGIKAKVGNHKVRFDCYDAAGNTVSGPQQTIAVKADAEVDVEYPCPVE